MIKSFKEYVESLDESFDIIDGKLVFNAQSTDDSGISSKFGKGKAYTPFVKKVEGVPDLFSYSLYQAKSANATDVLKAIKAADMNDQLVRAFITRSAIYAARVLRSLKADIIVTPHSSSPLVNTFVKELAKRTSSEIYIDSFAKRPDLTKVEIDTTHPNITPAIAKSMQSTLNRAVKQGYLSVKMFAVMHRKFLKNMFEVTDPKIIDKVKDKNVLIIDDVMTSGTTTKNIYDILKTNEADNVSALTLFKSVK
jgi:pyrimidine operon attenuation protein/uracil phosphoribosyltransferase